MRPILSMLVTSVLIATGSPTAAALQWEAQELVDGGRIDAIADLGKGTLLLGTRSPNPGRVFRSDDYGRSWRDISGESGKVTEEHITCIAPAGEGVVYFCTGGGHVWKSTDRGTTWHDLGKISHNLNTEGAALCYGLTMLPSGTMLLSDTYTPGGHVYRSTDQGETWEDLGSISSRALYRFEKTSDGVIVNGWEGAIFKSIDDGRSWVKKVTLSDTALFATVVLDNGDLLQGDADGELFRSSDQGESWDSVGKVGDAADDFADLGNGVVLYSTYTNSFAVHVSRDHGLHWQSLGPVSTGVPGDILDHFIAVHEPQEGAVVVGGTVKGFAVRLSASRLHTSEKANPRDLQ